MCFEVVLESSGALPLCDLVPHSCCNPSQRKALEREYTPLMANNDLPDITLPPVPKTLADDKRREEILAEIREAKPETVVLLGNEPIKWFLNHYDSTWKTLSDFGDTADSYGRPHQIAIAGNTYNVIGLCHPRQAARLGSHSAKWNSLHEQWLKRNNA